MNSNDISCLKGLYRTELLKALVAFNSDWILEEDGEVIARVGPTFFHDKGCMWRYRHRPMRKDGTARVQDFKELTRDEFKEIYPSSMDACVRPGGRGSAARIRRARCSLRSSRLQMLQARSCGLVSRLNFRKSSARLSASHPA